MATPTYQANTSTEQLRQSTCPYCGVGCGVDISCNVNGRVVSLDKICGTPEHPATKRPQARSDSVLDPSDSALNLSASQHAR